MTYNPFSLQGKKILVTGASSGIGRCTAIECAKSGATVIITARNKERLEQTISLLPGVDHSFIVADITTESDLDNLINQLPSLDGVVLSAGIGITVPLQFATRKKINPIFETNLFAQTELLRLLQKKKLLKNGASIVAIASIGGTIAFNLGNGPYGAAKAALQSWMKFAAQELASRKVRVNCICPGMIHTPLVDTPGAFSAEELKTYTDAIPLKRFGEPEEIAWGAIYLLSDASSWTTGTSLIIDGGTTI